MEEVTQAFAGDFLPLAEKLLNGCALNIAGKKCYLQEIEFYLYSAEHKDEYTHKNDDQKIYGKWYVHKYKNGTHKNGTYKGLDIVLGNDSAYFGILVRGIAIDGALISGPCNSVNKILEVTSLSLAELDSLRWDLDNGIVFLEFGEISDGEIYSGPRIGLSDKYPEWKSLNYRFVKNKNTTKKKGELRKVEK